MPHRPLRRCGLRSGVYRSSLRLNRGRGSTESEIRRFLVEGSVVAWPVNMPPPLPLDELHDLQKTRRLLSAFVPPLLNETMWSTVRSTRLPHQVHHGCRRMSRLRTRRYASV